jgi:hypothetical protein
MQGLAHDGRDFTIKWLVGAMMLEQSDEWSLNRRYRQLERLQLIDDFEFTRYPSGEPILS